MEFKFYWKSGKTEILSGVNFADALIKAGYADSLHEVDHYEPIEESCENDRRKKD